MFWTSIACGIGMFFSNWEIWIGIFIYGVIFLSIQLLIGFMVNSGSGDNYVSKNSDLIKMILETILEGVLISFLVTAVLPIFRGGDGFISLSFLTQNWLGIVKLGLISMVVTFLLSYVPIGTFIFKLHGASIFVQCLLIFELLVNNVFIEVLEGLSVENTVAPGFWIWIGFILFSVLISILIVYSLTIGLINLLIYLKIISERSRAAITLLIHNFIGIIPGILTLCIWCSYIQLESLI